MPENTNPFKVVLPEKFLECHDTLKRISFTPTLLENIRKKWIVYNLHFHKSEYVLPIEYEILIITWNMASKVYPQFIEVLLEALIPKTFTKPTILFISFQEIVDLTAKGFFAHKIGKDDTASLVEGHLGSFLHKRGFVTVATSNLFGLMGAVYFLDPATQTPEESIDIREFLNMQGLHSRQSEEPKRTVTATTTTLSLGMMGGFIANKGAVAFSLKVGESKICLIGCHLQAHFGGNDKRINDLRNITNRLEFAKGEKLDSFDYVFVAGDLNFRLELASVESFFEAIKTKNYSGILEQDQLIKALKSESFLREFKEASISFKPTYKLVPNSGSYVFESLSNEVKNRMKIYNNIIGGYMLSALESADEKLFSRIPSWTDRVLYLCNSNSENNLMFRNSDYGYKEITPIKYDSMRLPTHSDHHPVYKNFSGSMLEKDQEKLNKITEHLNKIFKNFKSTNVPKAKIIRILRANSESIETHFSEKIVLGFPGIWFGVNSSVICLHLMNPILFKIRVKLGMDIDAKLTDCWAKAQRSEVVKVKERCFFLESLQEALVKFQVSINAANVFILHNQIIEGFGLKQEKGSNSVRMPSPEENRDSDLNKLMNLFLNDNSNTTETNTSSEVQENYQFNDNSSIRIELPYIIEAEHGESTKFTVSFKYFLGIIGVPLEYLSFKECANGKTGIPIVFTVLSSIVARKLIAGERITIALCHLRTIHVEIVNIIKALEQKINSKSEDLGSSYGKVLEGLGLDQLVAVLFHICQGLTRPLLKISTAIKIGKEFGAARENQQSQNNSEKIYNLHAQMKTEMKMLYYKTFYEVWKAFYGVELAPSHLEILEELLTKKSTFKLVLSENDNISTCIKLLFYHKY